MSSDSKRDLFDVTADHEALKKQFSKFTRELSQRLVSTDAHDASMQNFKKATNHVLSASVKPVYVKSILELTQADLIHATSLYRVMLRSMYPNHEFPETGRINVRKENINRDRNHLSILELGLDANTDEWVCIYYVINAKNMAEALHYIRTYAIAAGIAQFQRLMFVRPWRTELAVRNYDLLREQLRPDQVEGGRRKSNRCKRKTKRRN